MALLRTPQMPHPYDLLHPLHPPSVAITPSVSHCINMTSHQASSSRQPNAVSSALEQETGSGNFSAHRSGRRVTEVREFLPPGPYPNQRQSSYRSLQMPRNIVRARKDATLPSVPVGRPAEAAVPCVVALTGFALGIHAPVHSSSYPMYLEGYQLLVSGVWQAPPLLGSSCPAADSKRSPMPPQVHASRSTSTETISILTSSI